LSKPFLRLIACVAALSACATYQAKPLGTQPTLLRDVPHLIAPAGPMPLPGLAVHPFDPDDGLDMTEVALLAVANNPDLKAVRDERGIAQAELLSAGVLPDPQLSAGLDHPTNGPGYVNAFNLGLGYDLSALVTRGAGVNAARANSRSIDLTVLWQEWQVAQQARLLFVDSRQEQKELRELKAFRNLMDAGYQRARGALDAGDLTIDVVSADLAALQDASRGIHDLERRIATTKQDLNALLGLSPDVKLDLAGTPDLPEPDQKTIDANLAQLPRRRPDLLALQAGYASQEERFRKAVLAQFPALTIGLTRARDTSGVYTSGVGITLSLPFFDRNRGAIAVEKATRERLYDEYQARLNGAYAQVQDLLEQARLVSNQYNAVENDLPNMERTAERAKAALDSGDLDITTYTGFQAALLRKRIEAISLEQTLLEQRVALQTLLGRELPPSLAPRSVHLEEGGS
jgi:outer membrane protein TolC